MTPPNNNSPPKMEPHPSSEIFPSIPETFQSPVTLVQKCFNLPHLKKVNLNMNLNPQI